MCQRSGGSVSALKNVPRCASNTCAVCVDCFFLITTRSDRIRNHTVSDSYFLLACGLRCIRDRSVSSSNSTSDLQPRNSAARKKDAPYRIRTVTILKQYIKYFFPSRSASTNTLLVSIALALLRHSHAYGSRALWISSDRKPCYIAVRKAVLIIAEIDRQQH